MSPVGLRIMSTLYFFTWQRAQNSILRFLSKWIAKQTELQYQDNVAWWVNNPLLVFLDRKRGVTFTSNPRLHISHEIVVTYNWHQVSLTAESTLVQNCIPCWRNGMHWDTVCCTTNCYAPLEKPLLGHLLIRYKQRKTFSRKSKICLQGAEKVLRKLESNGPNV